ncbi:MAG: endonuclease/exonuclease/phosphatase family protein [Pseudomonadota bacterium]
MDQRYTEAANEPRTAVRGPRWARPTRAPRFESVVPRVNTRAPVVPAPARLRFLTFNIQVGIKTSKYRHYVTNGWKHVWPHEERQNNLARIADLIEQHDVVALQEIDSGSLRSGFRNQVEYLAEQADFPYWYTQTNRDLGMFAQHGNGLLSRVEPAGLEDHKLPGRLPGRGAIFVRIPFNGSTLTVVLLHLSLGTRSRDWQLHYVAERLQDESQFVIMGDLNTQMAAELSRSPLACLDIAVPVESPATFPAWQPQLALDHVLVSPNLQIRNYAALPCHVSDHLPISVTVEQAHAAAA